MYEDDEDDEIVQFSSPSVKFTPMVFLHAGAVLVGGIGEAISAAAKAIEEAACFHVNYEIQKAESGAFASEILSDLKNI